MDITTLVELAREYGLPCVEREGSVTVVGEKQLLIFNIVEETQCQLIEIY
jgi:hypothetical protein